ncbi:hypothetical protein D3C81_1396900 [compost metagenome]
MPESRTAKTMPVPAWWLMVRLTWPCSVNLTALDSRFLRICSRRWRSVNSVTGTWGSTLTSKARPLCSASGRNMPRRPSTRRSS